MLCRRVDALPVVVTLVVIVVVVVALVTPAVQHGRRPAQKPPSYPI
jgi:hypothetical protein